MRRNKNKRTVTMANELIYQFEDNKVNIIIENNEPLFEVGSVAIALGQSREVNGKLYPRQDRLSNNLKNADIKPFVRYGQNYINEEQLYDLMLEMKTDKARSFRKWVTSEVLPQIRKTGGYIPISESMTDAEIMSKALDIAHRTLATRDERIRQLEQNNFVLAAEKEVLNRELDESKEWYTIKRVAALNGFYWKDLSWKRLKNTSQYLGYDTPKVFDPNFKDGVNSYHIEVWRQEYPHLKY